ncbi:MAG TPA: 50S ribosomal protein L23, partial [Tenericutes bacterium]|nr:50S ribosomal protein L23 [Mycoplasmatota bacterium]
PIITEKASNNLADNKYTFEVRRDANKVQIKQAIESIFNVKVLDVNIINVKPKRKRVGRFVGKTKNIKKAIVTLAEGQSISIFNENN